jgi:hypothetical protein
LRMGRQLFSPRNVAGRGLEQLKKQPNFSVRLIEASPVIGCESVMQ